MDPSGIFFTSHAGDRSLVRTRAQWVCLVLLLLVLATLPWWASERWVSIGYATFITAVAVMVFEIDAIVKSVCAVIGFGSSRLSCWLASRFSGSGVSMP